MDAPLIGTQAVVVMAITLAALAALAWWLRRSAGRAAGQPFKIESAIALGERRSLVIVGIEGRRLLLGLTPGQVTLVTELERSFSGTLDRAVKDPQP